VAIQLGLSERQATKYYTEYWKLRRLYKLHSIYKELKGDLPLILKLYKALKKRGLNPNNVEWFVDLIELGVVKLPELQDQYQKYQDKVQTLHSNFQDMQYRMQQSERRLQYNQQDKTTAAAAVKVQ
jgi:hypothetical protein